MEAISVLCNEYTYIIENDGVSQRKLLLMKTNGMVIALLHSGRPLVHSQILSTR